MIRPLVAAALLWLGIAHAAAEDRPATVDVVANGFPASIVRLDASAPRILFIAGSGPTDRNGDNILGINAGYLRKLADELAANGVASLRYDKRGVAGSIGSATEAGLTIETFVDDAERVLDWYAREPGGPIIVAGHSEGGLIALRLAERGVPVAGLVLITAPGRPIAETLREQFSRYPPPLRDEAVALLDKILAGESPTRMSPPLLALFRPSIHPFLRSLFALRPAEMLAAVTQPTMVIGGGTDLQVTRADFDALTEARADIVPLWLAEMNHVLTDAPADIAGNFATYAQPDRPLAAGLADRIAQFALDAAGEAAD